MAPDSSNIKPSPLVEGRNAYRPLRPSTPIDLYLDGNEGLLRNGNALDKLIDADPELLRSYPSSNTLEKRIAVMLEVPPERVLLTSGADDALERLIRAMLAPGREMILPTPTFEMFEHFAALTGGVQIEIPWTSGKYPLAEVLNRVSENTALITVVTPNNPTGLTATADDLDTLSAAAPNALILVDLAYTEFADTDLTKKALSLPNAVVVRSFSKAWGLAGLRVGFAAGPVDVIEWMRIVGRPYAVSSLSIKIVDAYLQNGKGEMESFVSTVREQRNKLTELLLERGLEPLPSQTNFVFFTSPNPMWLFDGLKGMGILVRIYPGKPSLQDGLRITVPGDDVSFPRLQKAIDTVLAPEAVLLDIDDTIADVTDSYRKATVATAAAFGAEITFDDITAAKANGNANNDWELTWRLLEERQVDVSLEAVTDRFEAFYQGTDNAPGMCESETLLVAKEVLERIARRVKLGIVTGRPKSDALKFLKRYDIDHLFEVIVTMDDGPVKPDPGPVQLACKQLDITRAWMVGDTPDDMRSARSAGVLPIGVVAPADDPQIATSALTRAGAGRVINNISEIEELLP
jgi:histidinol-phosphate aminotransferase